MGTSLVTSLSEMISFVYGLVGKDHPLDGHPLWQEMGTSYVMSLSTLGWFLWFGWQGFSQARDGHPAQYMAIHYGLVTIQELGNGHPLKTKMVAMVWLE